MEETRIEAGFNARLYPALGGLLFHDHYKGICECDEMTILMGGFARVATQEKLLAEIAAELRRPAFILDWHGLGRSEGDFRDATVKRLLVDLKRSISHFNSRGVFKFNLIGHSLGACVIALAATDRDLKIGKQVLLAPALNQAFLLRYWFAKERGYDFNYAKWFGYNDQGFRLAMQAEGKVGVVDSYWPHENEFQQYCTQGREVKGIKILPDYWQTENFQNYDYPADRSSALHLHGSLDSAVPPMCVELGFIDARLIDGADHYFSGHEKEVARLVSEFIG